jgi:predicted RNase H-like HicB family nuclease
MIDLALQTTKIYKKDGKYLGVVEAMPGVWAQGDSRKEVIKLLRECAEVWIVARTKEKLTVSKN